MLSFGKGSHTYTIVYIFENEAISEDVAMRNYVLFEIAKKMGDVPAVSCYQ